jgi:hypothetical protein
LDGETDFVTTEENTSSPCGSNPRLGYVVSGADGQVLRTFSGEQTLPGEAGDINADGYADVAISTVTSSQFYTRVYSGNGWSLLQTISKGGRPASSVGDNNGDGYGDYVIGVGSGPAEIISGYNGSVLRTLPNATGFSFPNFIHRAGDWNGDGIEDIALGFNSTSTSAHDDVVLVASGSNATVLKSQSVHIEASTTSRFGEELVANQDLNGDGAKDILISDYYFNGDGLSQNGVVYSPFSIGECDLYDIDGTMICL